MDEYVYPGTSVLKNLRDIRDPERLSKFEMDMTTRRLSELARKPIRGRFDAEHLQAIHRYVFQDVYDWAGEKLTFPQLASGMAHFMGELNAIHPFRDGNGRVQREFIRTLAERNGYALVWSRVSREQMIDASKLSFQRADNSGLEEILQIALD